MTVSTYLRRMAKLHIDRGQLATHFRAFDSSNVSSLHEAQYDIEVALGWKPPPLTEDLSWMNPAHTAKLQAQKGKPKPYNTREARQARKAA